MKSTDFNFISDILNDWGNTTSTWTCTRYKSTDTCEETPESYIIEVLVAGLKKESIDISYNKKNSYYEVTIQLKENSKYVSTNKYVYAIPSDANMSGVAASISNGILTIKIPKDITKTEAGKIEVK